MGNWEIKTVPAPNWFNGHADQLKEDYLVLQDEAVKHGDFVRMRFYSFWLYMVAHPDLIQEMLVKRAKSFHKTQIIKRATRSFTNDNIFNSDGDYWKAQRKLMQPAFHSNRISAYADDMVALTQHTIENWQTGDTINIDRVMTEVTMRIIVKTMFSTELDSDIERFGDIISELFSLTSENVTRVFRPPNWVPTEANRRVQQAASTLEALYQKFMDDWRKTGEDRGDLLSMLMLSRYEDGSSMSDLQIMSELGTIFGAGHETTATTLTFTWMMLAKHPEIEAQLHAELDRVLGGRPATMADVRNLTFTEKIIKETMRLYPAAVSVSRQAIEDVEIGGNIIKKGTNISAAIQPVQRDPRFYDDPDTYNPSRWTPEMEADLPRYAYLPFGAGPRVCIGNQFAMMEAQLILATIAQQVSLTATYDKPVEPEFRFTLHPGMETVPMRVTVRQPATQPA